MGIQEQALYAGTPLSRFLDDQLPNRDSVVEAWVHEVTSNAVDATAPVVGRDSVGWAFELCIGLDLANTPPRMQELSYLPTDRCTATLAAAGFDHRPSRALAGQGTTDPVLLHWERTHHRVAVDDAQRGIFAACLDLASFRQPMHRWGNSRTVDRRRSLFLSLAMDEDSMGRSRELLDMMGHCWELYLARGRRALLTLGEKVVVAPEWATSFGVADLVIGRTLIDVKLAVEPTADDVATWLRQLLGYVLLDRHDTFRIDAVAVYSAWHGCLLTHPLGAFLATASAGPLSDLGQLRAEFHHALRDDVDSYLAWKERRRYA
ncbi:hypothetical protein [Amycolatopsis minnesotensis]|uniref:hypothetical protein n=1 Tax=Amycolatopsis minnesotensis TaxID=337894 RepID=UPI0031D69207